MFFTGYFKKTSARFEDGQTYVTLTIPNQEVLYIFKNKVLNWFDGKLKETSRQKLFDAIAAKNAAGICKELRQMLYTSISFHDYYENFYHGFLAGILYGMEYYVVKSNRESGNGRTDLYLRPAFVDMTAYFFEFKIAKTGEELEEKAKEALSQIEERHYTKELEAEGFHKIVKYGIAFYGKDCFVAVG